jgi:hypothetical protein
MKSLKELLDSVDHSDLYEEECEEYLQEKNVKVPSHNRVTIYTLAWRNGWRPKE